MKTNEKKTNVLRIRTTSEERGIYWVHELRQRGRGAWLEYDSTTKQHFVCARFEWVAVAACQNIANYTRQAHLYN